MADTSPTLTPVVSDEDVADVPTNDNKVQEDAAKDAAKDAVEDAADKTVEDAADKTVEEAFDWSGVLSNTWLERPDGSQVAAGEALASCSLVMLYFTASWCPPCRRFTPKLVELYRQQTNGAVEIVLVSSDDDDQDAAEYRSHQPWLSLPSLGREGSEAVRDLCQVRGIPQLLVLDSQAGDVVAQNAVPNAAEIFASVQ